MDIIIVSNFNGDYGLKNRMSNNLYYFYNFIKDNSKYKIKLYNFDENFNNDLTKKQF